MTVEIWILILWIEYALQSDSIIAEIRNFHCKLAEILFIHLDHQFIVKLTESKDNRTIL